MRRVLQNTVHQPLGVWGVCRHQLGRLRRLARYAFRSVGRGFPNTIDLAYDPSPRCTEWLVDNRMFTSPLVVIDVGVQGGIGPRWQHLGDFIEVHGFDALAEAIAPLDALGQPKHHYYAMALGNEDGERELFVAPEPTATSFYPHGTSRYGVDENVSRSAGTRPVPIRRLDTLSAQGVFERADFIKIDCEGFEPEILKGGRALLRKGVLAIEIETNFNTSPVLPQSHFGAVCEQLLPHGLTLFDLAFDRTPRASFLARAQSLGVSEAVTVARPTTINALFYRDTPPASADELLKRIAILEIYGMADTAYDALMAGADLLAKDFPLQSAADLLIRGRGRMVALRSYFRRRRRWTRKAAGHRTGRTATLPTRAG
jgi:FkbM family methyltransferase